MRFSKFSCAAAFTLFAVAGCQTIYPTQFVPSSALNVAYKNDTYDFKVVDLTPTSAIEANALWSYDPRPAPLGLQSAVGPINGFVIRGTSLGDECISGDCYLTAAVSESIDGFTADNYRDPPRSAARPYRIGVGDVFTVTRETATNDGLKSFQRETAVDYAGNIYLTDIGEVQVLDLTLSEAREIIADRFRDNRTSSSGSATVTGFNSQRVLVSTPGKRTSFVPITNTPMTLRQVYLQFSSGIDRDAKRQAVLLRRDGREYSMPAINVLRQSYNYDVYLRKDDEIQIFDESLIGVGSATVSADVLALQTAELERRRFESDQERARIADQRADAAEARALKQERYADEAARIADLNAQIALREEKRAQQQLQIMRQNAALAQNADAREQLAQARADRDEARKDAAEARAQAANARAARNLSLMEAQAAREDAAAQRAALEFELKKAAETRAARQLQLSESASQRAARDQQLAETAEQRETRTAQVAEQSAARDLARTRIDLGIEGQDRLFVSGEVGQQQTVPMPFSRHFTLAEAIYGSQGIQAVTGDPSRIYIIRAKSSVAGNVESYIFHFDGANLANTAAMTMFEMRPNDLVVVMPRAITNWSRFINQLVPTFSSIVSAANLGA